MTMSAPEGAFSTTHQNAPIFWIWRFLAIPNPPTQSQSGSARGRVCPWVLFYIFLEIGRIRPVDFKTLQGVPNTPYARL